MGDKTVSVRVRFEGGDQVKAGLQEVGREGTRALQGIGTMSRQTGANLQNAGYQVSDFFVQVAGGTAPSRALAQQLPQLLQGFGLVGVAASVLIAALPSLWSLFNSGVGDGKALEEQLKGLSEATSAYGKAFDLALEPMDKLIEKYGKLAGSVREARRENAEMARGEAVRALNGTLNSSGFSLGDQATTALLAVSGQDFRAPSAEMQKMVTLAGEVWAEIDNIRREYHLTAQQARDLATATAEVRTSADQGAVAQVAALESLKARLIEIYGSADAANLATGGMVKALNAALAAASEVTAIDMAGSIGAAAGEAARMAAYLWDSADAFAAAQKAAKGKSDMQLYGEGRLIAEQMIRESDPLYGGDGTGITKEIKPKRGGGAGKVDSDIARSVALTESLRTETEKYAVALDEINRLKAKGLISDETYARQLDKLNDKLGETGDLGKKAASAIRSAFDGLFDDPAAALKDLAKQLAMMALYAQLGKSFPSVFGADGIIPLANANGNVFSGGSVQAFAAGGIVSSATMFPMKGGLGVMGEAGPEAIMPLTRIGGKLGVAAAMGRGGGGGGTKVEVHNYGATPVTTDEQRGPNGERVVRLMVGKDLASGAHDGALRSRFGSRPNPVRR